jgi:uncharacterized membrane protein
MQKQSAREDPFAHQLALSLGMFSIGLGLAELLAPHAMARLVGIQENDRTASILRAFGAREVGAGVAILMQPHSPKPLWGRVAGDAVDLAYLGSAFTSESSDRGRAAAAAAAVFGVTVLDIVCAQRLGDLDRDQVEASRDVHVSKAITINRPIEQVYAYWRSFENLPRFMRKLQSVEQLDSRRSRWRAKGPAGMRLKWDSEITDEREGERIAWRSLPGGDVDHRGVVQFRPAPGARGTEVHAELDYRPPAGALGRTIGWIFGTNPEQQLSEDLRRFKQLLEVGEITVSDGPGLWRAARPSSRPQRVKALAGVQS